MKSKSIIFYFCICLMACLFEIRTASGQLNYIPDVPDLNQPILPFWGLLPDNACAPVSAANICIYWDKIILQVIISNKLIMLENNFE